MTDSFDSLLAMYAKIDAFLQKKDIKDVYFTQLLDNLEEDFSHIAQKLELSMQQYKQITHLENPILEEKLEE